MIRIANENDIAKITEIYEHIHDAEETGEVVIGWDRNIYPTYRTALYNSQFKKQVFG